MKNRFSLTDTPTQSDEDQSLTKEQRKQRLLEINESLKSNPKKHAEFIKRLKQFSKKED